MAGALATSTAPTRSESPIPEVPGSEMPAGVVTAWSLLTSSREVSGSEWRAVGAQLAQARVDDEDAQDWAARELAVVEAVERVKAWADAQGLAALSRLREAVQDHCQALVDRYAAAPTALTPLTASLVGAVSSGEVSAASWAAQRILAGAEMSAMDVRHETDTATVDEVMIATGLPEGEVRRRLALAVDRDGRGSVLHLGLAAGQVDLFRATTMHQQTAGLDTQVARAVCVRLLQTAPDGSVRSHRWFTQTLRRQVLRHATDAAAAHREGLQARRAYASMDDAGGTATLVTTGDAARVSAAMDRVDRLARRVRGDGDARTLDQLRSDIALDLILHGWTRPSTGCATDVADAAGGSNGAAGILGVKGRQELELFNRLHAEQPLALGPTTFVGAAPPARVTVVVSLASLLGVDESPGEIPGWGSISSSHARQMATAAGSTWRRLVTDPVNGAALDVSTSHYRPTQAMADLVAALDGTCRAPGCTVTAANCDLDHDRPWPHGPTAVANLSAKHRRHHNHKTRGTWRCVADLHGVLTWTTVAGRQYTTARFCYDDPHDRYVSDREIDEAARLGEAATDPPPF